MEKIKFEQGIEVERGAEGEYVLKFKLPRFTVTPDPTGGHLKQAKREILLAVRSFIDKAIEVVEEKGK